MPDGCETLPHGTTVDRRDGRVTAVRARGGEMVATLDWSGDQWTRAELTLPDRRSVHLVAGTTEHPVLGVVDRLCTADGAADGATLAHFGRVDWARPQCIPPLDRPGALPPGAGAAVLNLLAIAARNADIEALRYRGPYPTAGLFDALLASFLVSGDLAAVQGRFVADVERRAVLGTMATVDVPFEPAPFEWSWPHPAVCVQRRDGVERIYVHGHAFDRDRRGPRRVVLDGAGGCSAVVLVDAQCWATVVTVAESGAVVRAPEALPTAPPDLVGEPVGEGLAEVLAGIIAARAVASLRAAVHQVLASTPLLWGDPGLALVRATNRGIELHAGMVAALPTESGPLLRTLVDLVEPVALRLAQTTLADAHDDGRRADARR